MNSFSGLGAGKGWYKFKFILTPEELRDVFIDLKYSFAITNTRVPIGYTVKDKQSFFKNYETFYDKITSGKPWIRKEDFEIDGGIRLGITDNPKKIKFQKILDKNGDISTNFKLVRPSEPVINITPFYLFYRNGQLAIETFYEEGIIGLEINYPKIISIAHKGYEKFHKTSDYASSKFYENLIMRIKGKTKKAKTG